MAVQPYRSDTGPAALPAVGTLSYNGVTWGALYKSEVRGAVMDDAARRTTRYLEYTLVTEGLVTLPDGQPDTGATWRRLRIRLSEQGAALVYSGNGFGGLNVNTPGGVKDVAFGPVPKVIDFQPLGQGRSAFLRWQVTVRVPELGQTHTLTAHAPPPAQSPGMAALGLGRPVLQGVQGPAAAAAGPVIQYNYECSLGYDELGYSSLGVRGTLEIPLNRAGVGSRQITQTVDDFRQRFLDIQVDLTKFKVTRRAFNYSRDKRTCEFEFQAEELAPMGLPVGCTDARGNMSVRQITPGGGKISVFTGVIWGVTLRASYAVAPTYPRRTALEAFYALLWFRMHCSANARQLPLATPQNAPQQAPNLAQKPLDFVRRPAFFGPLLGGVLNGGQVAYDLGRTFGRWYGVAKPRTPAPPRWNALLSDFGLDEGLYADSKSISFEASWVLLVRWQDLITACGVWRWLGPESGAAPTALVGGNPWATSVKDIMGWSSWLSNRLDPDADVIVDLGGP